MLRIAKNFAQMLFWAEILSLLLAVAAKNCIKSARFYGSGVICLLTYLPNFEDYVWAGCDFLLGCVCVSAVPKG